MQRKTVICTLAAAVALNVDVLTNHALGRDQGQWEKSEISAWFNRQKMPDYPDYPDFPGVSCCGEADAYYADLVEVEGDKVYAIITDTREDGPLQRPHIPVGTRIQVPPHKNNDPRKDPFPLDHGVIFVGGVGPTVYCYIAMERGV